MLKYIGGGLLCVTKYHNQRPVIVLGKEVYENGMYGDFGGSKDITDISINDTIHREVYEELYINVSNIDKFPYIDLPVNDKEKYKLCVGTINGISETYFKKKFNLYNSDSYKSFTEISEIRRFYVQDVPKIRNNYMYDVHGIKCVIRPRTLKALKNKTIQKLLMQ